jgi:NAD(P)-dependent dehydrogenase (short-subunit alcohol dehydrogenase family)
MAATIGGAGEYVWYAASKGAVDTMVVGAAREVAKEGIRINAISPGMIDTDIHPPGRIEKLTPMLPTGRVGTAEEVADAILYSCRTRPLTSPAPTCESPGAVDPPIPRRGHAPTAQ